MACAAIRMSVRVRRCSVGLLTLLAVLVISCAVPGSRSFLLRTAGRALVHDEPARPADVIVIATDADGAGVLAAADMVQAGLASRVAVFADPPGPTDREFLKRGVEYFNAAAVSVQQLRALGVARVDIIARAVAGTEDEGSVLPDWCDAQALQGVIFVSTADHSRRANRVLRRAMQGHRTALIVRASPYSAFDPERWWHSRLGRRTEIVESEKLLLDIARHPFT